MKNKLMKALLCLFALLGSASVWADGVLPEMTTDMDHPVYYRMKNLYTNQYVIYNGAGNYMLVTSNARAASKFYFVQNGENVQVPETEDYAPCVKIYADGSGDKYLRSANSWDNSNTRHWYLYERTNDGFHGFVMCYTETKQDALKVGSADVNVTYRGQGQGAYSYKGSVFAVEKVTEGEFDDVPATLPQLSTTDAPKYYRMKNATFGKYMQYTGNTTNVALVDSEEDASLFYFVGSGADASTPQVKMYASNSGDCYLYSVTDGSTKWNNSSTRGWYLFTKKINDLNGVILTWDNASRNDAVCQLDKKGEKGAVYYGQDGRSYPQSLWIAEEVTATPAQLLQAAKDQLSETINTAKKYSVGSGYGQFSYLLPSTALPILTTDDSAPVLYRIANTRRQSSSKACYITEAGTLSTSTADAVEVYFKGSIADGLASVKMYNAKGQALANTGDSKPAAGDASNLTWDNEGTNVYIQARKSMQGGNYNGVVIAFNNPWHDDLAGDVSGGDVWYVGSSDPVVWAYTGNYDGSIFTLELVDPTQAAIPFDAEAFLQGAEAVLSSSSQSEVEAKTAEVEDMIAHLYFNMPKAGEFMLLKSHQYNSYVSCSSETKRFPMVSDADASSIFYYDGTQLVNYTTGLVFSNTPVTLTQGDDCNYTAVLKESGSIEFTTSRKKHIGIYSIYTKGGSTTVELLTKAAGNNLDGFNSWLEHEDADIDLVAVNALPVTIKSYGYASFSAPVDVEIPAGVEAYVGKVEGEYLVMTAVEGKIPANTGVILKGTAGETYDFAITKGAAAVAENDLKSTYYTKAAPANTYVLGNGTNGAGIYKFSGDNVAGFKAYLESASAVKTMVFGDEETAIQNVLNSTADSKVYDLSGRRVEKAQKGIYIQNGKKVVK